MIIKKLQLSDLETLWVLDQVCFDKSWTREALAEELEHPEGICVGIFLSPFEGEGQGEGCMAALLTRQIAGERWIFRIMTHPDCRRQGLANKLLEALPVETLWLEVSELNEPAIGFYEQAGFVKMSKRPGYYPEDAWVMVKR